MTILQVPGESDEPRAVPEDVAREAALAEAALAEAALV